MKILWISGRRMGSDMASSTEDSLCSHLSSKGHEICLISPGDINQANYLHVPLKDIRFPGLTSISGARDACRTIREMEISGYDFILIDWRYVSTMRKLIRDFSKPWSIIDRGPPSNLGPLNKLQKLYWKNAWKFADLESVGGLVVSKKHGDFVRGLTQFSKPLFVLPAGAGGNKFRIEKEDPSVELKLAYVGMLDRRRDVRRIIELSSKIEKKKINHHIFICGEGDMEGEIRQTVVGEKNISFLGKIDHNDVQELLSVCHVGILPMPDIPIWRISSTLKLAEYLAAGLAVVGPDHPGNRISEMGKCNLLEKEDWVNKSAERLCIEVNRGWSGIVESATNASRTLSWESISDRMVEKIESWRITISS